MSQFPSVMTNQTFDRFTRKDIHRIELSYHRRLAKHLGVSNQFARQLLEHGVNSLGANVSPQRRRELYLSLMDYYTTRRHYGFVVATQVSRHGIFNTKANRFVRVDRYLLTHYQLMILMDPSNDSDLESMLYTPKSSTR